MALILTTKIKQEITDFCNADFRYIGRAQYWYFDELEKKLNELNVQTSKGIEGAVKEMISDDEKCPIRDGYYRGFLLDLLKFVQTNLK